MVKKKKNFLVLCNSNGKNSFDVDERKLVSTQGERRDGVTFKCRYRTLKDRTKK